MKKNNFLNIKGALLDEKQLEVYLEKIASEHNLQKRSNKNTYPICRLQENFIFITKTYEILNQNLKKNINIHPAGEWIVDNYYIIEETYRMIKKELSLKKYINFVGIFNGLYDGFARIYVLASEIVAYTEGKIEVNKLKNVLQAYQKKKTLGMEEIWNISIFLYIALIEKIRNVCEKIYIAEIQKYKVESIIERLVENIDESKRRFKKDIYNEKIEQYESKESFIEYLSYRLKLYGKKGLQYTKILEEQVNKIGTTISEIIKREHFNTALQKVYIGNCIKSIQDIQRINFTEIFEEINSVENILKNDPAKIYSKMDHKTKAYYRNIIKELAKKNKISELYITQKVLELAEKNKSSKNEKKTHIGYYLISNGRKQLETYLGIKSKKALNKKNIYIGTIILLTSIIDFIVSLYLLKFSMIYAIVSLLLLYIPISEIVIKLAHYILSKIIKPKFIPKLYFRENIPEKYSTMVVIPTIIDSKEKLQEMFRNFEVYYLANKSRNIYFTLLGDCTSGNREKEDFDVEIIDEGKKIIEKLNNEYKDDKFSKFSFIYRKRTWNEKEKCYLGWERKRGILCEFNSFLLGKSKNTFIYNSMECNEVPKIKYVITLDSDTNLVLDSAKKLVGAMAHILNNPVIDKNRNIVVDGYGIIQPRIGIDIKSSNKSMFTKIFAGIGGTDFYSNAISDIYQDNFNEGIFTGKGIYDLEVFEEVLKNSIPENTVLSHDLLEGLYLKCGLASDIFLFDAYPSSYNTYITRSTRWVRGDWQIIRWLCKKIKNRKNENIKNPLGELDKFKIIDNLRRSLLEFTQFLGLLFFVLAEKISGISTNIVLWTIVISIFINIIIEIINYIVYKKEGVTKAESFSNNLGIVQRTIFREILSLGTIPYISYVYIKSILKTLYRVFKSKNHLLEWITADEAEKNSKNNLINYIKTMWINVLLGILFLFLFIFNKNVLILFFSILWIINPFIMFIISKPINKKNKVEKLNKKDIEYLRDIAKRTWKYFEDYLKPEFNFLPPDNYQESRPEKVVNRTSSTNIGLALISVISAYDFKFIDLDKCLKLINQMLETIRKLPKWNGHLYNWYNIKNLTPLKPEYISTVDSGNFIGYMYITKSFLEECVRIGIEADYKIDMQIQYIKQLISDTNFSKLYHEKVGLFSIGFSIDENRLTPSYYDLLASEARQASLIAIAKKDIPLEHWENLSRTLTVLNRKKGLISWSGTAFEYLMPNINIKRYEGSLLDESCKFMIMSQKKYCNKLGIPWGISESAFNLKDLNSNYQYKAFGIPWLGLKRGLADEAVVSSYGSIMALSDCPEDVINNIKILENKGMYNKYGFYESIDYTPDRISKNKTYEIVKTYMAHHQALILLSINNFINDSILQKRFSKNPEIESIDILLQEKMPENVIITKKKKEVVEKIKYIGYDNYVVRTINHIDERINNLNVISSEEYSVVFNQDGTGYSKYKDILINRYKETDYIKQGIQIYFKNINSGKIWSSYISEEEYDRNNYKIEFSPDMNKITKKEENIETVVKNIIAPNESVEIRNIKIKNNGKQNETVEITSMLEPILSTASQDIAHKAFNNLFLRYDELENGLLVRRNKRGNSNEINMAIGFFTKINEIENFKYEIDKEKLYRKIR